ncbi:uncharacterized protein [Halyomorpha halys]|uniref:uncharacterized protein isoform X3 n=1 Tax=Halyomorpha halys TaxID=286706 RepID=UPI0034D275C2
MVLFSMCTCSCGIFAGSRPPQQQMEKAGGGKKITRGQATSFGFRKATPEPPAAKKTQEQCNSFGFRKPSSTEQFIFQAGPFGAKKNSKPEPVSVKKTEQPAVTVQETIQPLLIAPVRPKSQNSCGARPKETKPANRFGFRGPQLSNKVADVDASSSHSLERGQPEPRKYRLEWNQLPRNQCAARLPVAAGYSAEADKRAKTAANTALSTVHADSVIEIQQLDHSPSMTNKFRQTQHQLQLQHELNLQQQREEQIQQQTAYSSNDETGDEGFETSTEEKQTRDKEANEKDVLGSGESPSEEMWGRGEALCDEDLCTSFAHIDKSPETPPLRSVLLKIEDPTFAPLAALSQSALLEDETLPDSPDLSCSSSPSSVEPLPPPPLSLSAKDSPGSPGTPTHGSNSLSGSDTRDRDFLIDDEIADQPGLVFDNRVGHRLVDTTRKIQKLADEVSEALASVNPRLTGSRQSVSTLSPCDSLTSDDLMADFDTSDFDELDDAALKSELQNQSSQVMREWSNLLTSHPGLKNGRRKPRLSGGSTSSGGGGVLDSPQSIASPIRASKKVSVSSPGEDGSDDSGIRVDRDTYQLIFQDVISIKSMLVRLQRTLQDEPTIVTSHTEDQGEESADLRRQIVLLRAQLEEEERKRAKLEEELHKVRPQPQGQSVRTSVNKATQTDRIRPVSTSQALFQTSPDNSSSSFVSCLNERKNIGKEQRCRRTDSY